MYWFDGSLVVLQEEIECEAMITRVLTKAKSYIDAPKTGHTAHLTIMSPHQVAFVQLSGDIILISKHLVLLTNGSAIQYSPSFHTLTQILTSGCWKKP